MLRGYGTTIDGWLSSWRLDRVCFFSSDASINAVPLPTGHRGGQRTGTTGEESPRPVSRKLDFTKGAVKRTSFGNKFIAACHAQ